MSVVAVDARMLLASGIGTYLQNVLPGVTRAAPGTEFHLLGGDELASGGWAAAANVRWGVVRAPIYSLREQVELPRAAPRETGLFWSPHYNVPLLHPGRLLVTLHDLLHVARPEYVRGAHRRAYARLMLRAVARASARICVSRFTADEFRRLAGDASPRTVVIPSGVDEGWFRVRPERRPHPRPYFLYVGNVKPHKNLHGLLRAFSSVADRLPHDLVVIGKKEGFIHGDRAAVDRASPLGDRVRFTGWVDDAALRQYFVHAEALLFPSFYEGFGLPPLEAMACGCPAIVSRAAALPETCGDAALYCDPHRPESLAAQMLALAGSPALREEMRQRGVEHARGFTWERSVRETGEVIADLLP